MRHNTQDSAWGDFYAQFEDFGVPSSGKLGPGSMATRNPYPPTNFPIFQPAQYMQNASPYFQQTTHTTHNLYQNQPAPQQYMVSHAHQMTPSYTPDQSAPFYHQSQSILVSMLPPSYPQQTAPSYTLPVQDDVSINADSQRPRTPPLHVPQAMLVESPNQLTLPATCEGSLLSGVSEDEDDDDDDEDEAMPKPKRKPPSRREVVPTLATHKEHRPKKLKKGVTMGYKKG